VAWKVSGEISKKKRTDWIREKKKKGKRNPECLREWGKGKEKLEGRDPSSAGRESL